MNHGAGIAQQYEVYGHEARECEMESTLWLSEKQQLKLSEGCATNIYAWLLVQLWESCMVPQGQQEGQGQQEALPSTLYLKYLSRAALSKNQPDGI